MVGGRVYFFSPPIEPIYPLIVYSEASDKSTLYGDNTELISDIAWNVSVMNAGSTTAISRQVIQVMRSIGYEREMKHDMAENGVYVKIMRFRGIKEVS